MLDFLPAKLSFVLVDQTRRHVGINGHLFAGHGIEGKARRDFGDTARTLGDDHEIDKDKDREEDQPDDEIALGHHHAESLDD